MSYGPSPWSPTSAASEDTEVTLPTAQEEEEEEEASLARMLQSHEDIRFASYRTAAKLRSLQKQTYLYHIDIWNMIEAFRENGLHGPDAQAKVTEAKVRALLASLYGNLVKRLPPSSASSSAAQSGPAATHPSFLRAKEAALFGFLWRALAPSADRVKVRTLKTVLAALCTGKLMDKLRYLFSQLSDADGHLMETRFVQFLRDIMKLPAAVGEYTNYTTEDIFGGGDTVTVNDFLETMMSDPGPQCLSWLLVLHRLINSETIFHPVTCGSCLVQGFHGLRYKSDRGSYHLCQNCFWRGKIDPEHTEDVFKEYNCFKSSSGKSSFKRSLQCIPSEKRNKSRIPHFPEEPERPLDLSNLVPPVAPSSNVAPKNGMFPSSSYGLHSASASSAGGSQFGIANDEHHLIAQYAHQLATKTSSGSRHSPGRKAISQSRQLVNDLEKRNREIMQDISQLRKYHNQAEDGRESSPKLMSELSHLRSRKDVLDDRLSELQGTRKELMTELEELMKLLYSSQKSEGGQQMPQIIVDPSGQPTGYHYNESMYRQQSD